MSTLIMVYDTETTGLPKWSEPSEHPDQPRVTQLCAELVNAETRAVEAAFHTIIKPDGWVIPRELEELTGITTEKALAIGVPMRDVMPIFMRLWDRSCLRVAHNESFDMRMMRIEILRDMGGSPEDADRWKVAPAFCTMANSTKILNLPPSEKMLSAGRRGPKPPNLAEAYRHFTGTALVNAHNAAADTAACRAVYFGIIDSQQQAA